MTRLVTCAIVACVVLAGCASPIAPPQEGRAVAPSYAFVVLGPEGAVIARVIMAAPGCPSIELDGVAEPMRVRALPATVPLRPSLGVPAESKPSAFPVLT